MSFAAIGQIVATPSLASPQPGGARLGGIGASAPALRSDAPTVAARLVAMGPAAVEDALASRLLSLGVKCSVKPIHSPMMAEGKAPPPGSMGMIHSRAVTCLRLHPDVDVERVRADAMEMLARASTPAPKRQIEGWLAELSVLVAKRQDDEFAENLRVEAYCGRVGRYPADVARVALLHRTWRFWPTWDELAGVLDGLNRFRTSLEIQLRAMGEDHRAPAHPDTPRLDYEAARRIIEEAGFVPVNVEAAE